MSTRVQAARGDLKNEAVLRVLLILCVITLWLCLVPFGLLMLGAGAWLPKAGMECHIGLFLLLVDAVATVFALRHSYLPLAAGLVSFIALFTWSWHLRRPLPIGALPMSQAAFVGVALIFMTISVLVRKAPNSTGNSISQS
jgi:hypothetical protein